MIGGENMIEKIKNWIIGLFDEEIKKWLQNAYDCGYKIGEEDATRRAHELFMFGVIQGFSLAEKDIDEINLDDLSESVVQELKDERNGS